MLKGPLILGSRISSASIAALLLSFTFGNFMSPALAQQQTNVLANGGEWRVVCTNNGKLLDCRTFVEVTQRSNHQVIASLTIRYPAATKKPVLLLRVPLGVLVTGPITIGVDRDPPEHTSIQTCTQAGCFAGAPVSEALLAAMRTGKKLKIIFYNVNKQPVTVTVPLAGFALAFNKIKS